MQFLRQDMEYPVSSNATASAVPLPAYGRQNSIQEDADRGFLSLLHPTICLHCKDTLWIMMFQPKLETNLLSPALDSSLL